MNNILNHIYEIRDKIFNKNESQPVATYHKLNTKEEIEQWLNENHNVHSSYSIKEDLTIDIYTGHKLNQYYLGWNIKFLPFKVSKKSTEEWLKHYDIKNYTINSDLTVDVKGDVHFKGKYLVFIPIQFGHITGSFDCSGTQLDNASGFPHKVDGNVDVSSTKISSLHGVTSEIGGSFHCSRNEKLFSLEYGPKKVGKDYMISYTPIKNMLNFSCEIGDNFISAYEPKPNFKGGYLSGVMLKELKPFYKNAEQYLGENFKEKTSLHLEIPGFDLNHILMQQITKKEQNKIK